jgi:hypothetical protein
MELADSGAITEYQEFSNINTLSVTLNPNAPPLAPSPVTKHIVGVRKPDISLRLVAIASLTDHSSDRLLAYQ